MNPTIKTAAETIISMCTDYLSGGLRESVFVANVERYARFMERELNPVPATQEEAEERKLDNQP